MLAPKYSPVKQKNVGVILRPIQSGHAEGVEVRLSVGKKGRGR